MVKENFIDLQKLKCYSLRSKLSVKIKRSEYFAINYDIQELSFWELFIESSSTVKKLNT